MAELDDSDRPRGRTGGGRTHAANVAAVEATYQLVLWLIPVLDAMPRRQKFQLGDRLQNSAIAVLDILIEAAYTRDRAALLQRANLDLEKLRFWIRLSKDLRLLAFPQYEHAARLIDNLGRQVGGWLKAERAARLPLPGASDAKAP